MLPSYKLGYMGYCLIVFVFWLLECQEWYVFHFSSGTQIFSQQNHHNGSEDMNNVPIPCRWKPVVQDTQDKVDKKQRHGKVQHLFGFFHNDCHQNGPIVWKHKAKKEKKKTVEKSCFLSTHKRHTCSCTTPIHPSIHPSIHTPFTDSPTQGRQQHCHVVW